MLTLAKQPGKTELVTAPSLEPVSTTEAKSQLAIASSDTSHDTQLALLIKASREQFEHDTSWRLIEQTHSLKFRQFEEFQFSERPIQSIDSVSYYDSGNSSQTLATTVYELDTQNEAFRLKPDQTFPATYDRWDAITIQFKVGDYDDAADVEAIAKQAILLLVGHYFENRDMLMSAAMQELVAYENLVRRYQRSSYP